MIKVHKIRLEPSEAQKQYFQQACNASRKAYNWACGKWKEAYKLRNEAYKAGIKSEDLPNLPSESELRKQFNSIKKQEFSWVLEVTKCAVQQGIIDFGVAVKNMFDDKKKGRRVRMPDFKRKGKSKETFYFDNAHKAELCVNKSLKVPLLGKVKMSEKLRFEGRILSVRISKKSDKWFASVSIETEDEIVIPPVGGIIGIDLGIKVFATLSNGESFIGPKANKAKEARIKRYQRSLSRKQNGSKNRTKAKTKLSRLHEQVANIRNDYIHKFTHKIASTYDTVVIEDLKVSKMMKSRFAKMIADQAWGETRRQLTYKIERRGGRLIVADQFFASSQICSCCGYRQAMPLNIRIFSCGGCGLVIDRDLNAAINLKNLAVRSTVSVCGAVASDSSLRKNQAVVLKQKINTAS